jgi:hypothetical protein
MHIGKDVFKLKEIKRERTKPVMDGVDVNSPGFASKVKNHQEMKEEIDFVNPEIICRMRCPQPQIPEKSYAQIDPFVLGKVIVYGNHALRHPVFFAGFIRIIGDK